MLSALFGHNYCVAVSLPPQQHHAADFILASSLMVGAAYFTNGTFWPHDAIGWVALSGGIVGLTIACVRLFRLCFSKQETDK